MWKGWLPNQLGVKRFPVTEAESSTGRTGHFGYGPHAMSGRHLLLLATMATVMAQEAPVATAPPQTTRNPAPTVYVICGAPGDEAHHEAFEKVLAGLRQWFGQSAGLAPSEVRVYYGPESEGYAGTATRANVESVCREAVQLTQSGQPVWMVVTGHANDAPGDVRFNLPGGDLSGKDLARLLEGAAAGDDAAPLTMILTTACSGRAVKHLAGPKRAIVAATTTTEPADETLFGECLLTALQNPRSDANKDQSLSLTEIFLATRAEVLSRYKDRGFIVTEHAGLDGDGDGRATQRPAENDATAAATPHHAIPLKTKPST